MRAGSPLTFPYLPAAFPGGYGFSYLPPPAPVSSWTEKQVVSTGGSFLLDPRVHKVRVGLAWDAGVDVDSSAVLLDKDLRVLEKIWFRNLRSVGDAVTHRFVGSFSPHWLLGVRVRACSLGARDPRPVARLCNSVAHLACHDALVTVL
jgi:hypothetical protein